MKKYRCPTCGAKTISAGRRISVSFFRNLYPFQMHRVTENGGSFCYACNTSFQFRTGNLPIIMNIVRPLLAVISLALALMVRNWIMTIVFISVVLLLYPVYIIAFAFICPIMPFNTDTLRVVEERPDVRININSSKYIKNYAVYGLKFKDEINSEKFKEAFPDGMVPAEFKPNKKGSLEYDIRIINRTAVPNEILYDGAKFLVEDHDGIFIAKGKVIKSELDI